MKKILPLVLLAVILAACQPKTETVPVDLNAAKAAVIESLDKYYSVLKAKDAAALPALLADDLLYTGTDPGEFWSKADAVRLFNQMFADSSFKWDFLVERREVRVAKDGNSAMVLEQMTIGVISAKMPVRLIYHCVKTGEAWQFDFLSVAFIPKNSDIGKLNKALE